MEEPYQYAGRLISLRKEKEKSINDMAYETKLSASTISNYERGTRTPDGKALVKLSDYFNCTTDYLLGVSDYRNKEDFQSSVERTNRLAYNIEKLPRGDAERFIMPLNACLEAMLKSPIKIGADDNKIFCHWKTILNSFLNICNTANTLNGKMKEGTAEYLPDVIAFIKSQNGFDTHVNRMYDDFANAILDNINDDEVRENIKGLIF